MATAVAHEHCSLCRIQVRIVQYGLPPQVAFPGRRKQPIQPDEWRQALRKRGWETCPDHAYCPECRAYLNTRVGKNQDVTRIVRLARVRDTV